MRSPLERLWKDRMDIYRWKDSVVSGITKLTKELKYSSVKCQVSKGALVDTGTDGVPTIISSHALFCGLDTDLQEGDEVVVTQRNGEKVTCAVGECFPYSAHKEFSVKRADTA